MHQEESSPDKKPSQDSQPPRALARQSMPEVEPRNRIHAAEAPVDCLTIFAVVDQQTYRKPTAYLQHCELPTAPHIKRSCPTHQHARKDTRKKHACLENMQAIERVHCQQRQRVQGKVKQPVA